MAPASAADILTLGFGTAVLMWTVAYLARLAGDAVSAPLLFALLLSVQLLAGVCAGRFSRRGLKAGLYGGLLTGVVNLLIVGSLIGGDTPNAIKSGAATWVIGTVLICGVLGGLGAAVGWVSRGRQGEKAPAEPDWTGGFALVAAVATFVLLGAGGVVTGTDEGLAVVDWPNTEGYNMFLYPFARMSGGIFFEHSHRLLGSLVGLTTLVLTVHLTASERRRWLVALAWFVLALVVFQGILGGLRVTGRFTLSTDAADTSPNVILAITHGVVGQIVFALLVALAAMRSRRWRSDAARTAVHSASTDRFFQTALVVLVVVQLVVGALLRHFTWALNILPYGLSTDPKKLESIGQGMLHLHITLAVLVVLVLVAVGVRAWGLYRTLPVLPRVGKWLLALGGVQIVLGIAALVVTSNDAPDRRATALDVAVTTAHQLVGAALLAGAVLALAWNYRLLRKAA